MPYTSSNPDIQRKSLDLDLLERLANRDPAAYTLEDIKEARKGLNDLLNERRRHLWEMDTVERMNRDK